MKMLTDIKGKRMKNRMLTHRCKKVPSRFTGRDIGRWFIIAKLKSPCGNSGFLCRCECGTIVFKPGPDIVPHIPCIICVNKQRDIYINRIYFKEEDFIFGQYRGINEKK